MNVASWRLNILAAARQLSAYNAATTRLPLTAVPGGAAVHTCAALLSLLSSRYA
jgi:hypothetical protein